MSRVIFRVRVRDRFSISVEGKKSKSVLMEKGVYFNN